MPRRSPEITPAIIVVVMLLCIALIVLGWWVMRPASRHNWANGPVTPGTVPSTLPASAEVLPPTPPPPPAPAGATYAQMLLGNPSDATSDENNRDNYLMLKPFFAVAYDNSAGEPRWVSWRLCATDLGTAPRKRTFDPDDTLPNGFLHVQTRMYTSSGFDRGHMCDHSDRAATLESSYATFVMTNIVPQAPNNNRKCWAQLENYCRELARSGDRLYITSGPAGKGGVGSNGAAETIADGRVVVPAETWKVIVVTADSGRDDLSAVNASDRVIAVDVPNDDTKCGEEWAGFRCAPATIEAKTGLHFFGALPVDVRFRFDAEVDRHSTEPPRPLVHSRY